MCTYSSFFPPYMSNPLCRFSIVVFLPLSFIFSTTSRKWRPTLFVLYSSRAQVSAFTVFWPSSQRNWYYCWRSLNDISEQVVKSKDFRRQTKEWWPLCEKCYRKSCKYMRNNPSRRKGKKIQLYNIKVLSTTVWRFLTNKDWKALNRKWQCTCGHGVRRICKLYSKGRRLANSRDVNPLETIWVIVDETTHKDPAHKTLDDLRQWLHLDTLWELVHSIRRHLENAGNKKEDILVTNIWDIQC